jgi:hypothetical protein
MLDGHGQRRCDLAFFGPRRSPAPTRPGSLLSKTTISAPGQAARTSSMTVPIVACSL